MKYKKHLLVFIIFVAFFIFLFSLLNIFLWHFNYKDEINQLIEFSNQKTTLNDENTLFFNNAFKDTNFLEVDFSKLKSLNNSTVGWIYVEGTEVNYPFVQADDNSYYLNHSFYKKYNTAGWVFLDYRNNIKFENKNTIIYAHSQNNKTMFGSLRNTLTNDWLNNSNNHIIKISTETENSIWQIFSIYVTPTTNDYLKINFDNDFSTFTQKLIARSTFSFGTTLTEDDRILTLSTCYNKNDKLVIHAKLIKTQFR